MRRSTALCQLEHEDGDRLQTRRKIEEPRKVFTIVPKDLGEGEDWEKDMFQSANKQPRKQSVSLLKKRK